MPRQSVGNKIFIRRDPLGDKVNVEEGGNEEGGLQWVDCWATDRALRKGTDYCCVVAVYDDTCV